LYKDIPKYFVWNKQGKIWTERKKKIMIGRMVSVNPAEGERYYLRILLSHCKGSVSFEDLHTVNSHLVATFREACLLRGLLQEDDHYDCCFEEACSLQMPSQLRHLFVVILAYCSVANPTSIWNKYKNDMSSDFLHHRGSAEVAKLLALKEIQYMLDMLGKNINDYSLIPSEINVDFLEQSSKIINDERTIPINEQDVQSYSELNAEQRTCFDHVMQCVDSNLSGMFFVDGPGGTGKSFLYRCLLANIRKKGFIALATASSGVAAWILPGGRTTHFRFKIPLEVQQSMQCNISKQSSLATLLRMAKIIVWDEAPMTHRFIIESVDRLFRDLTGSDLPFGGKIFVLGGDFRQVLPVIVKGSRTDISNAALVNSYLWPFFTKYKLYHNIRATFDQGFSDFLLQIGNGSHYVDNDEHVSIPVEMNIPFTHTEISLNELIKHVFPCFCTEDFESSFINRVILTPKNESVDFINDLLIDSFPGITIIYILHNY